MLVWGLVLIGVSGRKTRLRRLVIMPKLVIRREMMLSDAALVNRHQHRCVDRWVQAGQLRAGSHHE